MKITKLNRQTKGFTIVELMIALTVLSTILTMSTVILIQIGAIYSKGVNQANLQNSTRTVVSDLSSDLQFSGNVPQPCIPPPPAAPTVPIPTGSITCYAPSVLVPLGLPTDPRTVGSGSGQFQAYAFCIGTTRYSYALNRELGTDNGVSPAVTTTHVLWRDTLTNPNDPCLPLELSTATPADGNSVLGSGYEMLGNHMLLTRFKVYETSATSDIYNIDVWTAYGDSDLMKIQDSTGTNPGQANCLGGTDTQFCATSQISTTLIGRIY